MENIQKSLKQSGIPSFSAWTKITAKNTPNTPEMPLANDLDDINLHFEVLNSDTGIMMSIDQVPPVTSPSNLSFSSTTKKANSHAVKATAHEGRPPRAVTPYPKERTLLSPNSSIFFWKTVSPQVSPSPIGSPSPGIAEKEQPAL